jgi:hypothetical protein
MVEDSRLRVMMKLQRKTIILSRLGNASLPVLVAAGCSLASGYFLGMASCFRDLCAAIEIAI